VLRRIESLGVCVLGNVSPKAVLTETIDGEPVLTGIKLTDGTEVPCRIAVFSVGIRPRDELAIAAGIKCEGNNQGGRGITVDDYLQTSAKDVYAIGECASWKGQTYGLIAPGVEMADILSFNFTQTETPVGGFALRKMVFASSCTDTRKAH
jgi:nitrite reductase (NAD(P)H)